jgi:hypothetical protein
VNEVEPHYWHKITVRRTTWQDAEVSILVPASMKTADSIAALAAAVADGSNAWGNLHIDDKCLFLNRAKNVTDVPTQSYS